MNLYLQITTRCNQACLHCAFNCKPGHGEDMSYALAKEALDLASKYDMDVNLGGGEPTLHPLLMRFVRYALGKDLWVAIITNGSAVREDKWKDLTCLADHGHICLAVSQSPFHAPVKPYVGKWLEKVMRKGGHPLNPKGDSERLSISRVGRAKRNERRILAGNPYQCRERTVTVCFSDRPVCSSPIVSPNGRISFAGRSWPRSKMDSAISGILRDAYPGD